MWFFVVKLTTQRAEVLSAAVSSSIIQPIAAGPPITSVAVAVKQRPLKSGAEELADSPADLCPTATAAGLGTATDLAVSRHLGSASKGKTHAKIPNKQSGRALVSVRRLQSRRDCKQMLRNVAVCRQSAPAVL